MDPRLKSSVRILTAWLGDTIREQEGRKLFDRLERLRVLCRDYRADPSSKDIKEVERLIHETPSSDIWKITRAFTLYFQLVNLAEEDHRVHRILSYERDPNSHENMSIGHALGELKAKRVPSLKLKDALSRISIEPVLTAHPTEAKRRSVLQHLMRISNLWERLGDPLASIQKRGEYESSILETLEILWQTSEIRQRKLTVDNEISNTLYFFKKTIFTAVDDFYKSFESNLRRYYPGLKQPRAFLTFGSWVGGDRDGNPFVTPEISKQAMGRHRRVIIRRYLERLDELAGLLSFNQKFSSITPAFQSRLEKDLAEFPEIREREKDMEKGEFYRQKIDCMMERLKRTLSGQKGAYAHSSEFIEDLELMRASILAGGSPRAAKGTLTSLILEAKSFQFHLAHLDFRMHAEKIRQLALELVGNWPVDEDWPEIFLKFAPGTKRLEEDAKRTLDELKALRSIQEEFGPESANRLILSMTERPGDIWAALLAARQAGLVGEGEGGALSSMIDVIPLFETVPDLGRAADIMESLWMNATYREILKSRRNRQEIMLGYSDSNKYGGYLAANYNLYKTQKNLSAAAAKHGVELRFFHGKGGSIDRGGGPSHRAILAAPDSVPNFGLRITEQGEVISVKYGHPVVARRNFEQAAGAVLMAGLCPKPSRVTESDMKNFEAAMEELSELSLAEYRNLVYETFGFKEYFSQSTPIDLLERLRIASRPAFRNAIGSIEDLRAIPWVFSWTQSRQTISAWYGMGTALEQFMRRRGKSGARLLEQMYRRWPFFTSLIDNAQLSLAKTDMDIAERYSRLVQNEEIRDEIYGRIQNEYHLSVKHLLAILKQKTLLETSPVLKESIRLRNPYIDALNAVQIEFLRRWRKGHLSKRENEKVLEILLLATNGIAFGMKSTG